LDAAVGAGSKGVTKCLLEFHGVEPTRERLLMAIANGDFELIRLIWERLLQEDETRHDLHLIVIF
jgi:hypothetical protein